MTDADTKLRFDHLEGLIERVEALIVKEITELKNEQIAAVNKAMERLSDDQRRLWDAVRVLENDRNRVHGGGRVIGSLVTGLIAIVSSSAAAVFITKFLK